MAASTSLSEERSLTLSSSLTSGSLFFLFLIVLSLATDTTSASPRLLAFEMV